MTGYNRLDFAKNPRDLNIEIKLRNKIFPEKQTLQTKMIYIYKVISSSEISYYGHTNVSKLKYKKL